MNSACQEVASAACREAIALAQTNGNVVVLGKDANFYVYQDTTPVLKEPPRASNVFQDSVAQGVTDLAIAEGIGQGLRAAGFVASRLFSVEGAYLGEIVGSVPGRAAAVDSKAVTDGVKSLPNPYAGLQDASAYLKTQGVSRPDRVQILQSFSPQSMTVRQAGSSEFGLRYFSDPSRPHGGYLFETFPASRSSLAIKPEWSTMSGFKQFQVRPGTTILEGSAAPQGPYLPGGQTQKFILDWRNNLLEP